MGGIGRARASGILLGIGMGGFVDGIVLHQVLQWHGMLSTVLPPVTMEAMRTNMRADGFFHAATWIFSALAVLFLWGAARAREPLPKFRWYLGQFLVGWGLFNLVEGIIDHHLLGIHHVRGAPDPLWDFGFLLIGGIGVIALGVALSRSGREVVRFTQ
jgi:uncharacterized membrane protein